MIMARILLNYVYYSAVGHVVEALRYARGLHDANRGSEVHVALPDATAWELCDGCPWIAQTYRIDLAGPEPGSVAIPVLPREWDYIMDNNLMRLETGQPAPPGRLGQPGKLIRPDGHVSAPIGPRERAVLAYYDRADAELVARRGRGVLCPSMAAPPGLRYAPGARVRLEVPAASRAFARRYAHAGPRVCVLLAGSGTPRMYPSAATWIAILAALRGRFPAARFYVTGVRAPARGQTATLAYSDTELSQILASDEGITDCYDIGLWHQVALMEACDLLLSPHTGFAFLALCVGTPWLTISGGNWPEYFFNDVPFYSVLPDNPDYPYVGGIDGYGGGPRIPCMRPERLRAKIPEIVEGAAFLLDPGCTYAQAWRRHRANVSQARIRHDRMPAARPF
jgi:hypothetical protein